MNTDPREYTLFFRFIETFSPVGFKGIDRKDPLLLDLEEMMENNNQFFFIADLILLKILFTSKRSTQMIGIEPDDLNPYHFFEATHPDDIKRHDMGRTKLFKMANEFFITGKADRLLSTNLKIRNTAGEYSNLLVQCYLFYNSLPYKTVYEIQLHTNIDWFRKIKHGYHYYTGNDLSYFRYPDEEMLMKGNIFTDREFEIIRLIHLGFKSEQIAEKLFLSTNTINTHRKNILDKSGKTRISDIIYDLVKRGLL